MTRGVLVVDDDAAVARLVGAVLSREGLRTELAPDGPSALDRLQRGGVDLVLTDMTMPGMSGLELVRAAEDRGYTTPFLLMSAFLDVETERLLCAEPGIAGILRKPFELSRLLSDVQAVLAAAGRNASAADAGSAARGCAEDATPSPQGADCWALVRRDAYESVHAAWLRAVAGGSHRAGARPGLAAGNPERLEVACVLPGAPC